MRNLSVFLLAAALAAPVLPAAMPTAAPNPQDPQFQAKGDQHRTYVFPGTTEKIPYRLLVPSKWSKSQKLPMMVILHSGASVDVPFERGDGVLAKVAEQRGWIILAPMGYYSSPRYNSPYSPIPAKAAAPAAAPAAGGAKKNGPPPPTALDKQRSEDDVMMVTDLVAKEYNADQSRIYLFGNSFGGEGTWYLGQKYPERWAAIGVASAPISLDGYPYDRLKGLPLLIVHGEKDDVNSFAAAEKDAQLTKQNGVDVTWMPVKGGTHLEAWCTVFPQMLDYFEKHPKKK